MSKQSRGALTYEDVPWESGDSDDVPMSRRKRRLSRGPYRAAVVPRIADRVFDLPPDVRAEAADALMEIARFDAELGRTSLGSEAEFVPLASVLLRTESASSSQIENVTAGAKALAMAAIQEKAGANAQLVAANVAAMERAVIMAGSLNEDTLLDAHAALMVGHDYAGPGRYRTDQVWIGENAPTSHTAEFVPPRPERVPAAMADLLRFCDRDDVELLPQVAVAHAQFETIHPFADGNGRTGRALVHVLLKRFGATRRLTVPVSAGLLRNVRSYFDALSAYREGDPVPIVREFTAASFSAVANGRRLDADIADIYAQWEHSLSARRDAAVWRILPHLVRQPAVTVKFVHEAAGVSTPAAQRAVDQLVAAGIVVPASANRRNRVWIAEGIIGALDEFAARAGRSRPA
jgi:Fic family protein